MIGKHRAVAPKDGPRVSPRPHGHAEIEFTLAPPIASLRDGKTLVSAGRGLHALGERKVDAGRVAAEAQGDVAGLRPVVRSGGRGARGQADQGDDETKNTLHAGNPPARASDEAGDALPSRALTSRPISISADKSYPVSKPARSSM